MRTLLLGAALALASISGCAKDKTEAAAKATEEFPSMTLDEVEQGVTAKQLTAVDCNGDRTRKKLGVVPGAIIISDEEAYPVSELPADKTTKLVFYCADPG
ncbi:MAG: hypothetical protein HOV81_22170 [Kofleriaceae bacterium]|nr:hypothetical protein [Kofleriaceae bacterium]